MPLLDARLLDEVVSEEIARVGCGLVIERLLAGRRPPEPREGFFATEVEAWRVAAERRVFRLLGLRYERAPMQRAFVHYRSPEARVIDGPEPTAPDGAGDLVLADEGPHLEDALGPVWWRRCP